MQIWKGLDSIFTFSPWLYNGYFPTLEAVGSVSLLRCSIFWGLDQIWSIGKCYQSRPATRLSNFQSIFRLCLWRKVSEQDWEEKTKFPAFVTKMRVQRARSAETDYRRRRRRWRMLHFSCWHQVLIFHIPIDLNTHLERWIYQRWDFSGIVF